MPLKKPIVSDGFSQFCIKHNMLYAAITGSHSWGLERPDSDIDIRGIYGWPTRRAMSLFPGDDNVETKNDELDIQAYELAKVLRMLCAANGNIVEMLHNPLTVCVHQKWGRRLMQLGRRCLTKRLVNYYKGYATSQRKRAMQNRGGKALVYTYREIFSGIYLMASGEIVFDFADLRQRIEEQWFRSELLGWALENRQTPITMNQLNLFEKEWQYLTMLLNLEWAVSSLPENEPESFRDDCNSLLYEYRLSA